jgi:hypothetical protein
MRTRLLAALFLTLVFVVPASAQTTIDNTTFSSAVVSSTTNTISLTSVTCTGCTFGGGTWIYADQELMVVSPSYTSGTTNIPVSRGRENTVPSLHTTTAKVWVGPAPRFRVVDPPTGSCNKVGGPGANGFYPWINISNGYRWLCDNGQNINTSTVLWRATIPVTINGQAGSDATGDAALHQPSWIDTRHATVIARLERFASGLFAW